MIKQKLQIRVVPMMVYLLAIPLSSIDEIDRAKNHYSIKWIMKYCMAAFMLISGLSITPAQTTVTYDTTNAIFLNPERGFSAARSSALTKSYIENLKAENVSVVQRIYTIPEFIDQELSDDFLNTVEDDFSIARENGIKLVIRFSYTNDEDGADAPLDTILTHIEQLKPLLQDNYDVIAYIEAGFIGAWGEWYYSSNNLNNTEDRRTVLLALLDALPSDRCVVVRTPDYKRQIFDDDTPLTLEEAFNGTNVARTGAHNDCFLANETDYGTYLTSDVEGDKDYLNQDNRFVPQGGETCCDCGYAGCTNALEDLARMHWSVLNQDYNLDVLDSWEESGCMDEIKRRLGYRFELIQATIPDSIKPGGIFDMEFKMYNDGFASPYNARNLEVVIENTTTMERYRLLSDEDPRLWLSGDTAYVEINGGVPEDITEGNYNTYLFLPDPVDSLHDNPDYAVRLANKDVWVDSLGFNSLSHSVLISGEVEGADYTGDDYFVLYKSGYQGSTGNTIVIDGSFDDWSNIQQLDVSPNEEDSSDTEYSSADIIDLWAADDEDALYLSYSLAGEYNSNYFYHIFIDVDNDTSTGFHSGGSYAGIDVMIENENVWIYSGTSGEWSWSSDGEITQAVSTSGNNRVEVAIDKSIFELTGDTIGLLFNINENDDDSDDDYAPDNYKEVSYEYEFTVTGIEEAAEETEEEVSSAGVIGAYPNPFNGTVNIVFDIEPASIKKIYICNILGEIVKEFPRSEYKNSEVQWRSGCSVSSGVYFFVISTGNEIYSRKLMLLK